MTINFADWADIKLVKDDYFCRRFVLSDEASFSLNGFVNKQNSYMWAKENHCEPPLNSLKLTVWCCLHAGGIIGPHFFRNPVTVNGQRYQAMLNNFLFPKINQLNTENIWFEQNGAKCHTAHFTINLLQNQFGDNSISRSGNVYCSTYSFDSKPFDYFLWGYVNLLVYGDKPATFDALEDIGQTRDETVVKN